jgi:hypothetical protein
VTKIKKSVLPRDERGNDPNDYRGEGNFLESVKPIDSLSRFALNGNAKTMRTKMLEDQFILGRLAILGQSTAFFSAPNVGKTLITISLLIEAIKGGLSAEDVFYLNADDNFRGLVHKLEIAEKYGFRMLAPGHNQFKAEMLPEILADLVRGDDASGKVLILDTVKKFCDLMRKDKASMFGSIVREFVSHGGSVIMLAHVNKHRNEQGKVIYAGTSDLVDDADCAYTLDILSNDKGHRTVLFENFKSRGDVALEASYAYSAGEGVSYHSRLESVVSVGDDERDRLQRQRYLDERLERNRDAIGAIKAAISAGFRAKTDLVSEAVKQSGISKARILKTLAEHTGANVSDNHLWALQIEAKNRHVYALNWGAR